MRWYCPCGFKSNTFQFVVALAIVVGWTELVINGRAVADFLATKAFLTVDEVFEIDTGSKTITCGGPVNGNYVSGSAKSISNAFVFTPLNDSVKSLKAKVKKAKGSKRDKLKKKLSTLQKRTKSENSICAAGPGGAPPTGTPTSPNPTPTPTPRPTQSGGNFDANGNVTSQGKTAFGIPSSLNANKNTGQSTYTSNCKGCHSSENTGRSYSSYGALIKGSPMFIFDLSDQDLADITAYLNRFKTS